MKDLYIGDYVYDEGVSKKQDKYPKQVQEPEYSLETRIALGMVFLVTLVSLFVFIHYNH
jgi:hypothetical protein